MKRFNPQGLAWSQRCARGRVLLVDDDPEVLQGLGGLLTMEGYACELFESAEAALAALPGPDGDPVCVLSDVRMPGQDGLALQQRLAQAAHMPMLLMSGAATPQDVVQAFRAGAVDVLLKPIDAEVLLEAVARALVLSQARQRLATHAADGQARLARLTPREREVARRVARGELNREIAATLGIALRTVKHHRAVAMEKLGLDSTVDLARLMDTHDA